MCRAGGADGGGDGIVAREVRREVERGIGASVGVKHSSGGPRGQLVGGTAEGQVADFEVTSSSERLVDSRIGFDEQRRVKAERESSRLYFFLTYLGGIALKTT